MSTKARPDALERQTGRYFQVLFTAILFTVLSISSVVNVFQADDITSNLSLGATALEQIQNGAPSLGASIANQTLRFTNTKPPKVSNSTNLTSTPTVNASSSSLIGQPSKPSQSPQERPFATNLTSAVPTELKCTNTSHHTVTYGTGFRRGSIWTTYKIPYNAFYKLVRSHIRSYSDNSTSPIKAACKFQTNSISYHFPHTMQQIYGCWGYWKLFEEALKEHQNTTATNGIERILLLTTKEHWYLNQTSFNRGILYALQRPPFNVKLEQEDEIKHKNAAIVKSNPRGYFMPHGGEFRDGLLSQLNYQRPVMNEADPCCCPNVTFLNRKVKSGRSVINLDDILGGMQPLVPWQQEGVPVAYFEDGFSFEDQIKFFASTDILFTTHGAQLTGLIGMPQTGCSQFIEAYPEGLVWDYFFGSLAGQLNISYSYFSGTSRRMKTLQQRKEVRAQNICPSVSSMTAELRLMIDNWRSCCRARQH